MRILTPLHGFVAWNGGLDLARSMSNALRAVAQERALSLSYAVPEPSFLQRAVAGGLRRWRIARSKDAGATARNTQEVLRRATEQITSGCESISCKDGAAGIRLAAESSAADVIFPTMVPIGSFDCPRVGYIFDFQHHHFPHLFSRRIRANRDRRFRALAEDADTIVVNSRAAALDATKFLDIPANRVFAMPFAPHAMPWWFDVEPEEARARYGIGRRYLMVCNHFWVHKDHETAIKAFALLGKAYNLGELELVLTGDPVDHRDPAHYGRMVALVSRLGLNKRVRFLGLVPKRDQLALMRGCALLVQPTLFEGGPGGGSVAEAVGLGVPAVVSDIGVNREVDADEVAFFRAGDATDLAGKAASMLATNPLRPSRPDLIAKGQRNLKHLGNAIADHLQELVAKRARR